MRDLRDILKKIFMNKIYFKSVLIFSIVLNVNASFGKIPIKNGKFGCVSDNKILFFENTKDGEESEYNLNLLDINSGKKSKIATNLHCKNIIKILLIHNKQVIL